MMHKLILSVLLIANISWAQTSTTPGAHSHGAAELKIVIDGKKGKLELHSPTSAIYGFEHEARSKADQMRKDKGLKKLDEKISEIFVFAENLQCKLKKEVSEVQQEKSHANIMAEFSFECAQPLKGTEMTVSIQKNFPKIKKLNVQLIVDDVQKSVEVTKDGEKIGFQ